MRTPGLLVLLLCAAPVAAQDTLRLGPLQEAAVSRDPRARQLALREAEAELRLGTLAAERLPRLSATAEATYQSEVAAVPIRIPGSEAPTPPHERVEAALGAEVLLYDGGSVGARREAERAHLAAERAALAAELHPLRMEAAEAYYGALLLQERLRESVVLAEELDARLAEARAAVAAGAALPGDTAALRAELLRVALRQAELRADRLASRAVLGSLAGRQLPEGAVLALSAPPAAAVEAALEGGVPRAHPRFAALAARRAALQRQEAVVAARGRPQASAFARLAYGRPGLEQFTRELHPYSLAGVRLQWAPWDWGTRTREREALRIQREILDTEEAALAERLARQVERPRRAAERLRAALETDEQIIALREQVARQARVQFAERAISASRLVEALSELEAARVERLRHRVELARSEAEILTILGLPLP